MLIKSADDVSAIIEALEVTASGSGPQAKRASMDLRNRKAGLRGERDAAYLVDFDFAASPNWAVVHDLRVEHRGRIAQIDHLLINRWLQVYVLETKQFHAGIKITDEGEFLRWNNFDKRFEGMASPLAQNERHIEVLRDVFSAMDLPTRAGFRISPEFMSLILVSPQARIDRPKRFDTSRVIKADLLKKTIWKDIDSENAFIGLLKTAAKIISGETLRDLALALARQHRPLDQAVPAAAERPESPPPESGTETASRVPDTTARSGISDSSAAAPACKSCAASKGEVLYGKFGYYFKCAACSANTAIRFKCHAGHSPRLRKDGAKFYRDCAECSSSAIYFINEVAR